MVYYICCVCVICFMCLCVCSVGRGNCPDVLCSFRNCEKTWKPAKLGNWVKTTLKPVLIKRIRTKPRMSIFFQIGSSQTPSRLWQLLATLPARRDGTIACSLLRVMWWPSGYLRRGPILLQICEYIHAYKHIHMQTPIIRINAYML